MEPAVSTVLAGASLARLRRGTTWETCGLGKAPKRGGSPFFGWSRSPQQAELLATVGNWCTLVCRER